MLIIVITSQKIALLLLPHSMHTGSGHSSHTEEEQSLFDPLPYGWSAGGGAMSGCPKAF